MSCEYCTQTKGALRMAQSSAMSPTQMRLQWAHPGLLLPRCPRGHFVSPRTMTCRPCGNLVLGSPQPWPPQGYYVSMRRAVTDLQSGVGDHLVAEHKRTKPRTITLFVDPSTGKLVRAVPDAEMAAPAPSPSISLSQPVAVVGGEAVYVVPDTSSYLSGSKTPPVAGPDNLEHNRCPNCGRLLSLRGNCPRCDKQATAVEHAGLAYIAKGIQDGAERVNLDAVPPGVPESQWAKLDENGKRRVLGGMVARGELVPAAADNPSGMEFEPGSAAVKCPRCGKFMSATQGCRYCTEQAAAPTEAEAVATQQATADEMAVESAVVAADAILDTPASLVSDERPTGPAVSERVAKWYSEQRRKKGLPVVPAPGMPMPAIANMLTKAGSEEGIVLTPLTLGDLSPGETKANRQGESRWSRAQELIDRLKPTETPGVYEYGGGRGKPPYVIDLNAMSPAGQRGTCTCEDCQNVAANGTRCKHILAAHQRAARDGVVLGARATSTASSPTPATAPDTTADLDREEQIRRQIEAVTGVSSADLVALERAGCPPRIAFADPPSIDETFELTPQGEEVLQGMGGVIRFNLAQRRAGREGACSMGIYGPPGTGKNTIARQLAATLGLPFEETDVNKDTDVASLFGGVGIRAREGASETYADVSRIGMALESGAVVCINEVNTLPAETQTLLHQIAQEGRWTIPGPEGKHEVHYVHPSSVLVLTWNEKDGMPESALLSRLVTFEMQYPTEDQEREMLTRWVAGSGLPVDPHDLDSTTKLVRGLRTLYEQGSLAIPPSFRDMKNFYMMHKTTGNLVLAVRQLRKNLEQTFERASQWASVEPIIKRFFPQFRGLPW